MEDEFVVARTINKALEIYGYKVINASTGEEAIEIFKKNNSIDLILMDIELGEGIDGTQAALIILKERFLPLVFLSNHTEPEILEKIEKITSYGYVVKNSGITVLDASIKMAFKLFESQKLTKEREELLRRAEMISGLGSWEFDLASNTFKASEGARRIYGIEENEVSIAVVQKIPLTNYRDMLDSALRDLVEQGSPYDVIFEIRRPVDEKLIWLHSIAKYDPERNSVTGIIHDITEKKKIEQLNSNLLKVIQSLDEAIIVQNLKGAINGWNRGAEKLYGYSNEEALGSEALIILPEDKIAENKGISEVVKSGAQINNHETFHRHKNGGLIPVSINVSPVYGPDNKITGISTIATDLSGIKKMEKELEGSIKLASIGEMTSMLSHDFNNYLSVILGFCELGLLTTPETDKNHLKLKTIMDCAEKASAISRNLLGLAANSKNEKRTEDIHRTIDSALNLRKRDIENGKYNISKNYDKFIPRLKADHEILVTSVFANIITNAFQAMPDGGSLEISTSKTSLNECDYLRVDIKDTGHGISIDKTREIFEPFFTTKPKGTGLGLAHALKIVRAHGGHIEVESALEKGTLFKIFLPFSKPD